jgi:hypothetical protein
MFHVAFLKMPLLVTLALVIPFYSTAATCYGPNAWLAIWTVLRHNVRLGHVLSEACCTLRDSLPVIKSTCGLDDYLPR